jgi:hypothetical protein
MRTLAPAFVLALLCACSGYTSGDQTGGGGGVGHLDSGQPDGGDGGPDGGDAGPDGGPDAGCTARTLNGTAVDNCQAGAFATMSGTISGPGQGCAVTINLTTASTPCVGVASGGTNDAFDGGCLGTGFSCTSTSLPGTLTCTTGTGTCTIIICDAGTCP